MRKSLLVSILVFLFPVFLVSCGGGGGGGGGGISQPAGTQVFASLDNSAYITVSSGTIPEYVNAVNPTLRAVSELPDGFIINPGFGDINVTKGGVAYTFNLNSDIGFTTTKDNVISMTFPFDPSLVPIEYHSSELNVFITIFNPGDKSICIVHGIVNVSGSVGTVTIETKGLPTTFTAVVIFNPNIMAQTITLNDSQTTALSSRPLSTTGLPPWPASMWCVYYNPLSDNLIKSVEKILSVSAPSPAQIDCVVYTYVAQAARNAQNIYMAGGFRAPNINRSEEACGGNIERVPKYRLALGSFGGSKYSLDPNFNVFGVIKIEESEIGDTSTSDLGSVKAAVAHEMLHAIQDGYEFAAYGSTRGYVEGTATTFGATIDNGYFIKVRTYNTYETKLLSNPLAVATFDANGATSENYSNQDFFAYVGRQYNSGSLYYLSGLFQSLRDAIGSPSRSNPTNSVLYRAMENNFNTKFGKSLSDIYLDFVRQRAFDHNKNSQFERSGETTVGFSKELFDPSAITPVSIRPSDCGGIFIDAGTIAGVKPYSSRAIDITYNSSSPLPSGEGVTVKVDITSTLSPLYTINYYSGASITISNTGNKSNSIFSKFGEVNNDNVTMILSNTDINNNASYEYIVTCNTCNYYISPTSKPFSSSGGSGSIIVTASSGCSWTAVSNNDWITVPPGSSGTDNGTVTYNVTAGTSARTGTISVAGQVFTVTQAVPPSEIVVNFDSLPAWVSDDGMSSANVSGAPLAAYLGSFGITYTESQTLQVGAEYFLGASSGQNMLTVVAPGSYVSGGSTVGTFTLYFSQPVTSLSFVKIGMGGPHAGNVGVAQWTATAYSALNEVTGSASRPYEWNPSQETIALAGSEIDHVTFTSDWGPSRAGTLLWIDDLTFTPVP